MLNYSYKFLVLTALWLVLPSDLISQNKTISIQSLRSEGNLKQGKMIFSGAVKINFKDYFIKAEEVIVKSHNNAVQYIKVFKDIEALITLDGNNSYEIKAQKLIYQAKMQDFRFEGNVTIQDSQRSRLIRGDIIHLNEINQSIYINGASENPMQIIFQLDN